MCILLYYYAIQSLNEQHISYAIKQKICIPFPNETEKKQLQQQQQQQQIECPGSKINESAENVNVATNEMT